MRQRSLTGPLLLLLIGALFLWRNLHPETPVLELIARYWPLLLIAWGLLRLLEVVFQRDPQYGPFTGGEIALAILICCAGSLLWAAHEHGIRFNVRGLDWWGSPYDYPVAAHAPAGGATQIVFENARGSLRVTGGDTTEVTVTGHKTVRSYARDAADRTNGRTPVEIVTEGGRILIRTNQDHAPEDQQISDDLDVTVPRSVSLQAHGHTGDYEIDGVAGNLELAADRGDVRLARVGGNVRLDIARSDLIRAVDMTGARLDLQGRGSDVELENIAGQVTINGAYNGTLDFKKLAKQLVFEGARNTELNVQAVPGHINMALGEFNGSGLVGPVRLIGQSRDIRIEQFTQSLELANDRGDVELHPGRVPLPSIEVRTGSGRIDLALPAKAAFQLDATAERGDVENDFGPQIRKESDGRSATLKGNVGDGPTLHITSGRGAISVRQEVGAPADSAEKL
jgi:DUF4097 and DUF4098 domain-containing protein YvlB